MKGRHKSVTNSKALNASYAGKKGPTLNSKIDMNSQQSLIRHKMQAPDINSEILDVSIPNNDNRYKSNAKVSKLPHLMGNKQSKGEKTQSPEASKGGQTIEGGQQQVATGNDTSESGGIVFMESDHVPVFMPAVEANGGAAQLNQPGRESPNIDVQDQEREEGTGGIVQAAAQSDD